jgi:3-phosphoshikimate 1-carboxyvinyltransferase
MGADLTMLPGSEQAGEPCGELIVRSSRLHGAEIAGDLVVRMIDEFPVFAVAAAYAKGPTVVRDAKELRYKESDRISALCGELRRLGVEVEEKPDGFMMNGGRPLSGGTVNPHGDHRLAMALAVAGLAAQFPVTIGGAEIIGESFPEFAPILRELGANLVQ